MSRQSLQDLTYAAVFAALIIALGFVVIPTGAIGIPIVLQNAAIVLAGLVLGPKRAAYTLGIFFVLGLVFPVLAGGRTVLVALAGPTAGYLVGYTLSALLAGYLAYRAQPTKASRALHFSGAAVAAILLQYGCGIIGLLLRTGITFNKAVVAQLPFIGPDVIKFAVAVAVALTVHTAFPRLVTPRP